MTEAEANLPDPEVQRVCAAIAATLIATGRPMATEALVDALTGEPSLHSLRHGIVSVTAKQVTAALARMRACGAVIATPSAAGDDVWRLPGTPPRSPAPLAEDLVIPAEADSVDSVGDAVFVVRAMHGPPGPVLLISVLGEVDRLNEARLFAHVHEADRFFDRPPTRPLKDSETIVVVDLRGVSFVSAGVYNGLLAEAAIAQQRLRLVLPARGAPRRALQALGLETEFRVYHRVPDAVLGEPDWSAGTGPG